jgi:hypothetical protein
VQALRRGEVPGPRPLRRSLCRDDADRHGEIDPDFRPMQLQPFTRVDRFVASKWERMKIQPSSVCSDCGFSPTYPSRFDRPSSDCPNACARISG